jgi:histidine triad (HIT) family protein
MSPETDCLFCGIVDGRIPATRVHEDDLTVAFRDVAPQAPVHVLVIPKRHVTSLGAADDGDGDLLGRLLITARDVARAEGIAEAGYRVVLNTGDEGGQTVRHLHVHVLGGRPMKWPPG